jgi:hypothetical protein
VAVPSQVTSQSIHPPSKKKKTSKKTLPSKNLVSFFSKSFIYSGKHEGGATVLREGRDIVTRETCSPTSLNLGKVAVLHFALFCGWGHAKLSLPNIRNSCAYVKFS